MFFLRRGEEALLKSLMSRLDHNRHGTHYSDRMDRILGVCHDCGILFRDEKVSYRNGATEIKRLAMVESSGAVSVTPQYEKYGLSVNPKVLPKLKGMADQFAYALNVPGTSVEVDGNTVYVRVPRLHAGQENTITFREALTIAPDLPAGSLLLGVDDDYQQLVLDMTSPNNVHAAVIGMTGSGKSTLMQTMILSAQIGETCDMALFDPSQGFAPLAGHPRVWRGGLFATADECEQGLEALTRLIGKGRRKMLCVFVDEVPELVAMRPRIKDHLARLAQAGRHAGIHLIIGAQHALASQLGSMTMRNVPTRLVGRVSDHSAAYQATGRKESGAENLRGRGDFVIVNGGTLQHFQAAYPTNQLLGERERRYPPRQARLPAQPAKIAPGPNPQKRATGDRDVTPVGAYGTGGGRGLDDIPTAVCEAIVQYREVNGRAPSLNWVRRLTANTLPSGGFGRDKARRAISMSQSRNSRRSA